MNVAVAIFLFKRVQYIESIFRVLNSTDIFNDVFCFIDQDEGSPWHQDTIAQVVNRSSSESKRLHIVKRDRNLGSGENLRVGLDEVFRSHEACIVLEDDILPAQPFLEFAIAALKRYINDQRIGVITGSNYAARFLQRSEQEVVVSRTFTLWGWAIWRDRWFAYRNFGDSNLLAQVTSGSFWINAPVLSRQQLVTSFFQHLRVPTAAWDLPLVMYLLCSNRLCLLPTRNMVENLGIDDDDGVHTSQAIKRIEADSIFRADHFPDDLNLDQNYEDILALFQAKSLGIGLPIGIPRVYHGIWEQI